MEIATMTGFFAVADMGPCPVCSGSMLRGQSLMYDPEKELMHEMCFYPNWEDVRFAERAEEDKQAVFDSSRGVL